MACPSKSIIPVFLFVLISNVAAESLDLPEGAPCRVEDYELVGDNEVYISYPGICRHWKNCFNLVLDIRDKKYPPLCSFDGPDPIICCTGCNTTDDVSKVVLNPRGGILWKTDQKSWNKCIDYFVELPYQFKDHQKGLFRKAWNSTRGCFEFRQGYVLAAGGRDARRAEFPHMALLGYGPTRATAQWLCGGSLLNERFILTAGHCISRSDIGKVQYAALGILKRSDPPELWQTYSIQRIIRHPKYRPPSKYHDIALLKTMRRISFNENVLPSCLPNLAMSADDDTAEATGWGLTGVHTQLADHLQAVEVSKYSDAACSARYKSHRHMTRGYSSDIQMCYGDEKTIKDTCSGDSGGPLQIWGQVYFEQRTVIGVTSHGPECRTPGQAGIYTRVKPYVPWIDSIIW